MRVVRVSLTIVLGAVVGASLMFAYLRHKQDPFSYELDTSKPSYTSEALFDSDILLPDIKNISGRMKFRSGRDKPNELKVDTSWT